MVTHVRGKTEHIEDVTQGRASEIAGKALLFELIRRDDMTDVIVTGQLGSYLFEVWSLYLISPLSHAV